MGKIKSTAIHFYIRMMTVSIILCVAVSVTGLPVEIKLADIEQPHAKDINMDVGIRNDFLLQNCQGAKLKRTFPDLDYALMGYHIIKGYPLAKGHDPGFTYPIFKADYSHGRQTDDCRFSIPDGYTIVPDVSCQTMFTSDTLTSSFDLRKKMGLSAKVEGGGWGLSFSASAEYQKESQSLDEKKKVFIISSATCQYYFASIDMVNPPAFDDSFVDWMKKLNDTKSTDEDYLQFIDYYGTNFMTKVAFGARYMYQHITDEDTSKSLEKEGLSVEASLGYSGFGINVGGSFGYSQSKERMASNYRKKVSTSTESVGAPPPENGDALSWASKVKETPIPFRYEMSSIEEIFTPAFMQRYPEIDGARIKGNLQYVKVNFRQKIHDRASKQGAGCRVFKSALKIDYALGIIDSNTLHCTSNTLKKCLQECFRRSTCVGVTPDLTGRYTFTLLLSPNRTDNSDPLQLNINRTSSSFLFPYKLHINTQITLLNSGIRGGSCYENHTISLSENILIRLLGSFTVLYECTKSCHQDGRCVAAQVSILRPDEYMCCKLSNAMLERAEIIKQSDNAVMFIKSC